MALNTNKNLKTYYSIQEVAEMFNVKESLLRFWESEFPQISPRRAGRGIRQYTQDDIKLIGTIHDLVKRRGMKLSAAREVLKKNKDGAYKISEALDILSQVREQLVQMRSSLSGVEEGKEYEVEDGE